MWSLVNAFTFEGNTADTSLVADIMTVEVKPVLNRHKNRLGFRALAIAENPSQLIGMGTARFRIVKRVVHGTDYDLVNGIQRQPKGALTTDVPIDQTVTYATPFEDFDVTRFKESDTAGRMGLIQGWIESLALNFLDNEELLLLRAHKDFCLATYPQNPNSVLVLDFASIASDGSPDSIQEATEAYYNIHNNRIIPLRRMINQVAVGIENAELFGFLGMTAWSRLSQAFTKFNATELGAEILSAGVTKYSYSLLGTEIVENMWLEQDMPANDINRRMNKDVDFMFANMQGAFMLKGMWTFANGMIKNQFVQNFFNLNLELVTKAMFSMPEPLYEWAGFVIWPQQPTLEEITTAQNNVYDYMSANFAKSFQLPKWMQASGGNFTIDVQLNNSGVSNPAKYNIKSIVKTPFAAQFQNGGTTDLFDALIQTPEIQNLITNYNWKQPDILDYFLNRMHLVSYGPDNYASTAVIGPSLPPTTTLTALATAAQAAGQKGGWVDTDSGTSFLQAYIDPRPYVTGSNTAHPVTGTTGVTMSTPQQINFLLRSM